MTLKQRISGTLVVLSVLMLFVGISNTLSQSSARTKTQIALLLSDVGSEIYAARLYQRYTMMEPQNEQHPIQVRENLSNATKAAQEALVLMQLPESQQQTKRVLTSIADFRNAYERYATGLKNGVAMTKEDANIMVSAAKAVSSNLNAIKATQLEILDDKNSTTKALNLTVLVVALLSAALAGRWLYRSIITPIRELRKVTSHLAKGDLSQRVTLAGKDELTTISASLNEAIDSLAKMLNSVNAASGQLGDSVNSVGAALHQSLDSINQQHQQTELVATAVTEMASATEEIAGNAAETALQSTQGNQLIEEGKLDVEKTVEAMSHLGADMQNTTEMVTQLAEDNKKVDQILVSIRAIAEQTNLLALNAAIEAARAGEQGRGFAVVADEVRQLAQRTQNSIQEITAIIESINNGTKNVVQVIGLSRESAEKAIERTRHLGDLFSQVAEVIAKINDMNSQISVGVEEQSAVAKDVSENIVLIKTHADENKQGLLDITQQSDEQVKLLKQLETKVAQFILV